jgi:hypothetical protein
MAAMPPLWLKRGLRFAQGLNLRTDHFLVHVLDAIVYPDLPE